MLESVSLLLEPRELLELRSQEALPTLLLFRIFSFSCSFLKCIIKKETSLGKVNNLKVEVSIH